MRIRFEVPPEYQLFDTRKAVYAQGPGDALIIFDSEPQPAEFQHLTMSQYVSGATRAELGEVEAMRINGQEAATGAIKVQGTNGPIELRLAAIRTEPAHIYRFRFVTPLSLLPQLGPANLRSFQSFRPLTAARAAALKPLRVRVVSVKKGDTVATMAKRMAFDSYAADRFRVLNWLPPGVEFVSSRRVKIITAQGAGAGGTRGGGGGAQLRRQADLDSVPGRPRTRPAQAFGRILEQLAKVLKVDSECSTFWQAVSSRPHATSINNPEELAAAWKAFRREVKRKKKP